MKCLKFLITFLLLSLTFFSYSQEKRVRIRVEQYNDKEKTSTSGIQGAAVFGCTNKKRAQTLVKNFKKIEFEPREGKDYDYYNKTSANGETHLLLDISNDYIVVRLLNSDKPKIVAVDGKLNITVTFEIDDDGRTMGEVTKTGKFKRVNSQKAGQRFGNRKEVPIDYILFEDETKSNARVILAPQVLRCDKFEDNLNGNVYENRNPFVKDGEEYHKTQQRRMLYNLKNDPLEKFRDKNFMRTRVEDRIQGTITVFLEKKGIRYPVVAKKWFEDYNTKYSEDTMICLNDGFDIEPFRFLDFKITNSPIDTLRYKKVGRATKQEIKKELMFNFAKGKGEFDVTDSINSLQINSLEATVLPFYTSVDATIHGVTIKGYASPEGSAAINLRLCRERSRFIKGIIEDLFPNLPHGVFHVEEPEIASWTDVVAELRKDTITNPSHIEMANEVEQLINLYGANVFGRIRSLSYYKYLDDNILPKLRKVDFTFETETNRVRTPEEIMHLYLSDKGYQDGTKPMDYEFYELFRQIKDPKKLEILAKRALSRIPDTERNRRPWPYAAYVLAQCYLQRDTFDTKLMLPYIDHARDTVATKMYRKRDINQQELGWYNDTTFVITQIQMLCKEGDYIMADSLAHCLLPPTIQFERLRNFVKCLNGHYNDSAVRRTVFSSGNFNKALVLAAPSNPKEEKQQALKLFQDSCNQQDPRVLYMQTALRFELEAIKSQDPQKDTTYYRDVHFIKHFEDDFEITGTGYGGSLEKEKPEDWGWPLVLACSKNKEFLKYAFIDGYFDAKFRRSFKRYWAKREERLRKARERENAENGN